MPPAPTLILIAAFCLVSLAAMLQNGFVITVLGREWVRSRALPAADVIVGSLASSRFLLHGLAVLDNLLASFGFCYEANLGGIFWDFINTLSLWFTAWLAVFYCVKISSFPHRALLWMKWRISRFVSRLLLASLLLGGLSAVMSAAGNISAAQMTGSPENCTLGHKGVVFFRYYYLSHALLMWFAPFLLSLCALLWLMRSLSRHVGRARRPGPGLPSASVQAHAVALKTLAFFLLVYTLFFVPLVISVTKSTTVQSPWYWVREVVTYAGISLHSLSLVLSNPKLRKALRMRS